VAPSECLFTELTLDESPLDVVFCPVAAAVVLLLSSDFWSSDFFPNIPVRHEMRCCSSNWLTSEEKTHFVFSI
jgi:hypothetical protein